MSSFHVFDFSVCGSDSYHLKSATMPVFHLAESRFSRCSMIFWYRYLLCGCLHAILVARRSLCGFKAILHLRNSIWPRSDDGCLRLSGGLMKVRGGPG